MIDEDNDPFNRTNSIHIITSVSRRLNILSIMFKIGAFFITTQLAVQVLGFYADVRNIRMITSFYFEGRLRHLKTSLTRHFLSKCL